MITFDSVATLPIADGVGTVGYKVVDADGAVLAARTTTGVALVYDGADYGIYAATVTLAAEADDVTVVWDDGAGNAAQHNASDVDPVFAGQFITSATLPIVSGVGTVGVALKTAAGATIAARTTSGISRIFAGADYGIYQASIEPATDVARGLAIWDDAAGNAVARRFSLGSEADTDGTKRLQVVVVEAGELVVLDDVPELAAPSGNYGLVRLDTGATVIASGSAFSHVGGGLYQKTFVEPAEDLTYRYYVKIEHDDVTYYLPRTTAYVTSAVLAIGRYTTTAQIEATFGVENFHKWLGIDHNDEAVDYAMRAYAFIADAEDELDDLLRGGPCVVPLTGDIPRIIAKIAANLAAVRAYENRGVVDMDEETGQVQHRLQYQHRWAEKQIARIKSGQIQLADDDVTRHPTIITED